MTSLPVPVSPVIKTVAFVGATASTSASTGRRPPWRPTIVWRNDGRVHGSSPNASLRPSGRRKPTSSLLGSPEYAFARSLDSISLRPPAVGAPIITPILLLTLRTAVRGTALPLPVSLRDSVARKGGLNP